MFKSSQEAIEKFPVLFLPPTEKNLLLKTQKNGYLAYFNSDEKVLKGWFSKIDKSRPRDGFWGGANFRQLQGENHQLKRLVNPKTTFLKKHSVKWLKAHDYQFFTSYMSAGIFKAKIEVAYSPSSKQTFTYYNCGGLYPKWQPDPAPAKTLFT
ncbi:MAG: hypothetical protein MK132_15265 [Lentisphaerales bacterium]|nr:hypothetical protein [Lentisphaerales bacterium]